MSVSQYNIYPGLTPVRLASSGNIAGTYFNGNSNNGVGAQLTIAASSLTIDSVVCNVNDRVLLYAQSSANQNGIYVVNSIGATVVLQRSADMQSIEQYKEGQYVFAAAGSVLAGDSFTLIEPLPAVLGINNMSWASGAAAGYVQFSGPASVANALAVFSDTAGDIKAQSTASTLGYGLTISTGNLAVSAGNISAGSSGNAGTFVSFPASAANGSLILKAVNAGGAYNTTISSGTIGQSSVITIPDPGAATANFVLDAGNAASLSVLNLKYGATPVAQVDPASCTIVGAAGASNVCNVTIQLKDGGGNNMSRIIPFRVYASSAADGLTLASAASTGFAVASGGLSLQNAAAVTTQISAMSSATGGCVLSLTDTGKQTSYLVLVLANGCKISAQLSSGSYGA